ncbi:signal peptide, CUB and EGF domain-containing protein 2, partial [Biomphalaria glabrata]
YNTVLQSSSSSTYLKTGLLSSDAGAYKCRIQIGTFTSQDSNYVIVAFNAPTRPSLTTQAGYDSKYGSSVVLQCTITQATAYDLVWAQLYKNGVRVAQQAATSTTTTFSEVSLTRTGGSYTCSYSNFRGESPQSLPITITVNNLVLNAPTISATASAVARIFSTSVTCSTSFDTNQIFYCSLYLNKKQYAEDADCVFPIPHGITGSFNCTVSSLTSTSQFSPYNTITFFDEPTVLPVSTAPPIPNQFYALQCIQDINGPINWFKNYDDVTNIGTNSTLSVLIRSSEIKNLYKCVVTYYTFKISSAYYTVFSSLPVTPTLTMDRGDTFLRNKDVTKFTCSSTESGETFSLYRDGMRVFEKPGNGTVTFVTKIGKNGAFYTCTTTNAFGESMQSNSLYVPGLNQLYITASNLSQTIGQQLKLDCSMKNPPAGVTYTWNIYKVSGYSVLSNSQTLPLLSLADSDKGLYSCQININGQIIRADNYYLITFDRPPAPDILLITSSTSATAQVQCFIQSLFIDVQKTFKLYQNGNLTKNVPYEDVRSFNNGFNFWRYYTIDTSIQANQGNYSCTALNFNGESPQSKTVSVSYTTAFTVPVITTSVPNPSMGSSVILTCSVTNSSAVDYQFTWQKDFKPIIANSRILALTSLGVEDDGYYVCNYQFQYQGITNILTSDAFYISLRTPLQPSLLLDPAYLEFDRDTYDLGDGPMYYVFGLGEIVHVKCFSQVPHISVTDWKNKKLTSKYTYRLISNNILVDSSIGGDFAISNLAAGNNTYTCLAEGSGSQSNQSYPLVVRVAPRPILYQSIQSASSRTLQCLVQQASNGFDIIWKKNNIYLRERSTTLNMPNFSQADEGTYSCRQQAGPYYLATSEKLALAYGTKPATPDIVGDNLSERGSPGVISCVAPSTTAFKALFYKNNVNFYNTTDGYFDEGGQAVFNYTIPSISANDAGSYMCRIESSLGLSDLTTASDIIYVGQCSNNPCEQNCKENDLGTNFNCSCLPGFSLNNDGKTCGVCDSNHYGEGCAFTCACIVNNTAKCDSVTGNCQCSTGWEGPTCDSDINECNSNLDFCKNASNCINTIGSFMCSCPKGFINATSGKACEDIDECLTNPCKATEACLNTNGSYSCSCKPGYQGTSSGGDCIDIDECSSQSNPCAQQCSNVLGGYICSCSDGYMFDQNKKCVSVFRREFEIHYPSVSPSDNVLTLNSLEYNNTQGEIYNTINRQLQLLAKGYLDCSASNLRKGSLVATITVNMNKDAYTNLGGYLTKALTMMNMSELTINETRQPDAYIFVKSLRVQKDTPQCDLRALIDPCASNENCNVDDEGISYCQIQM